MTDLDMTQPPQYVLFDNQAVLAGRKEFDNANIEFHGFGFYFERAVEAMEKSLIERGRLPLAALEANTDNGTAKPGYVLGLEAAAEIAREEQSRQLRERGNNEFDEIWQIHNYGAVVSANIYDAIRSLAASPVAPTRMGDDVVEREQEG